MEWKVQNNKLVKTFVMQGFSEVVQKLNQLAIYANSKNHHPDFRVFEYRKIEFELWSYNVNKITARDHQMAAFIDNLFG